MLLSCKQASQLISQSLDRPLSVRERLLLRYHLFICRPCRRFTKHLALMRLTIKRMIEEIEQNEYIQLPQQVRARIAKAIESNHS
ncbi:MAG: hypothetical protein CVU35_00590 [Betaproteobacteria bacterium HGW-Betaproteobacteria-8]|nr:MAG: hypothetical protein CVU35_00590 [Betaproteobacteria bacterium HGW-Betaproteobacteria-8]